MTEEQRDHPEPRLLGVLLAPLRAPARVVADIESIATAVLALQRDVRDRLASIDDRASALGLGVAALRPLLERVDRRVTQLAKLEQAVTLRMDAIHADLNTRMLAVEQEVQAMRAPIEKMSRDLATAVALLPDPSDGPFARLKDTLTSS